jgi:hypothetical protein
MSEGKKSPAALGCNTKNMALRMSTAKGSLSHRASTAFGRFLRPGESFELISFIPYPGHEAYVEKATSAALQAALDKANAAYRTKDEATILAMSKPMQDIGQPAASGTYNMIDKDGFHYAPSGGLTVVKTTNGNKPRGMLRVEKSMDLAPDVPVDLKQSVTHIVGITMSYVGDIMVAAHGALFLLDRDLSLKGMFPLPGEDVENSICADEQGIYVVTSKRMLKVVWTGTKLSIDEADGGWQSEYNTMSPEKAKAAGALTVSGGSGTTPTLNGFRQRSRQACCYFRRRSGRCSGRGVLRDKIPVDFKQQPGTKSPHWQDPVTFLRPA